MFLEDVLEPCDSYYNFWPFSNMFDGFYLLVPHGFLNTIKYALIQLIFGLEKCSLHKNGVEFIPAIDWYTLSYL